MHSNFHNGKNSNCIYHIVENIKRCFPHCGNNQCFFHKIIFTFNCDNPLCNYFEHFFHISTIEPTNLWRLPHILPQSNKFLLRACSWPSHNIPSLSRYDKVFFSMHVSDNISIIQCSAEVADGQTEFLAIFFISSNEMKIIPILVTGPLKLPLVF